MQKQTLHIAKNSSKSALMCQWILVLNIVLISAFNNNIFAQNLSIDWGKSWGSMQKESGNVLKKDSYGNMYLAGVFDKSFTYTISNIEYKISSKGRYDIFFAKLNVNGELVYMQTIGGADNDVLQDMDVDAAGNVYLCGNFLNAIDLGSVDSVAYHSKEDIVFFVAKYDTKGICLFARTFGDFGDDICKNIRIDAGGNIFISGFFTEKIGFYSKVDQLKSIYARGFNDVFLIKLNMDGNALWARNYRPNTEVQSLSMDFDKLGSVFLAGVYQGNMYINTGVKPIVLTSNLFSKDFYFSKYDSLGNLVFVKSVGNIGGEYVYQLCINQNSDIVIAGYFQQELDFDSSVNTTILKSQNVQDGFVAGYSNTGAFKYVQRFSIIGNNAKFSMITDQQSNIYLAGILFGEANFFGIGNRDTVVQSKGNADIS